MTIRVRRIDFTYQDKRYKIDKEHDTDEDKDVKYVLNTLNDAFANGLEKEFMKYFIANLRELHGGPLDMHKHSIREAAYHAAYEWDF